MTNKQLFNKLRNAYVTCFDCGNKYGQYHNGVSSVWIGKCDVCGEKKSITEARDFGFFITGIHKLAQVS